MCGGGGGVDQKVVKYSSTEIAFDGSFSGIRKALGRLKKLSGDSSVDRKISQQHHSLSHKSSCAAASLMMNKSKVVQHRSRVSASHQVHLFIAACMAPEHEGCSSASGEDFSKRLQKLFSEKF